MTGGTRVRSPVADAAAVPLWFVAREASRYVKVNTWLAGDILVKADRMTMAHGLELRVPYLDREVMAVAARLARQEKIGAGTTKVALRQAMSAVLPKAVAGPSWVSRALPAHRHDASLPFGEVREVGRVGEDVAGTTGNVDAFDDLGHLASCFVTICCE